MYHDGWKAVTFHPMLGIDYGDGRDPAAPFDDDEWELYHVAEDFSEVDDVAAEQPDKLKEMIELWWEEAERYHVLPLSNQPRRHGDRRYRRDRYVFRPGTGSLPEVIAPNLRGRAFHMVADLDVPAAGAVNGVIVCHGGAAGGYAVYAKDSRICYVNNFLGSQLTTISASVDLPPGSVAVRVVFTPTGPLQGTIELFYGDVPVGEGHVARTTPISYGVDGFSVGHQRGTSVTPAYQGRFPLPAGILRSVTIDGIGPPHRDPQAEERAALAQQ